MFPDKKTKSSELFERSKRIFPGGNTRHPIVFHPYLIYASHGDGARIIDIEGISRIDFVNNFSAQIHGHSHPKIVEAIIEQAKKMTSGVLPTEVELDLAELLVERLPSLEKIRFCNSGTEAVMYTIKAARAFTGRSIIAKIEGAYHGQYDLVETSFQPTVENWGPDEEPARTATARNTPESILNEVVTLQFNEVEQTRRLIEKYADKLAAVLIDPIPARMGFVRGTSEYLNMIRDVTKKHGIVLIFDEVFSLRLGYNGSQGVVGVTPDLCAMGKIIGGGLPVGAFGGNNEIMSLYDNLDGGAKVSHGGTFTANPMTMSAGLAAMNLLTENAFFELDRQGKRLRKGLEEAKAVSGVRAIITGEGSMTSIVWGNKPFRNYREFCMSAGPHNSELAAHFHRHMLNNGVLIAPQGPFLGSTAMSDDDIDFACEKALLGFRRIVQEQARIFESEN